VLEYLVPTLATLALVSGPAAWARWRVYTARAKAIDTFADRSYGRVAGTAGVDGDDREPVIAPMTGRPCVFYAVVVSQRDTAAPVAADGHPVLRVVSDEPFVVDDGTGRAIVQPSPEHTASSIEGPTIRGDMVNGVDRHRAFLSRYGVARAPEQWVNLWFRETIVSVGDHVVVAGYGVHEPDPTPPRDARAYRAGPSMRVRLSGSHKRPLVIKATAKPRLPRTATPGPPSAGAHQA
jgi:hypothetical protein